MLYYAPNVSAAVEMAEEMKRRGAHEWFRGQTRNWTLQSSLNRNKATYNESITRLQRFSGWLKCTPGLEALWNDVDGTVAVAQHYGLPTHFIDFTTEPYVAGYFASENAPTIDLESFDFDRERARFFTSEPATNRVGCILCLNREELVKTWLMVATLQPVPSDSEPQFLATKVPDLWRLEAQHGVFFYCPIGRFEEVVYDLDRIVFPHCGQIPWPPREMIYPARKSSLEILLDEYFLLERLSALKEAEQKAGVDKIPSNFVRMPAERKPTMPIHTSWEEAALQPYLSPTAAPFFPSLTEESWFMESSPTDAPKNVTESVTAQVLAKIEASPGVRHKLVRWQSASPSLDTTANLIWDGLRLLPCADRDIAIAIGTCAGLFCAAAQSPSKDGLSVTAFYRGSEVLEVEFSTQERGFSRAFLSKRSLLAAFRDDIKEFLDPTKSEWLLDHPGHVLLNTLAPNRLFPFDRFERLFIHEVVPSQAIWWAGLSVIFSPARISVFGLP
jgi:FRG domain